jgi:polyhydroxybutyrate depolymerase
MRYRQFAVESVTPEPPCYDAPMIRALLAMSAPLIALMVACAGNGGSPRPAGTAAVLSSPTAAACTPARAAPPGTTSVAIASGGVSRRYLLHIPPGYDGTMAVPLVLALHPYAGNAQLMLDITRLTDVADASGFIVVAPDAMGSAQLWNIEKAPGAADDVAFLRDLIARIDSDLCIDRERTYAAGYSNGGGMALRLACEMPERIAAVGVVASQYVNCDGSAALIAFHGTADPILPFAGGPSPDAPGLSLLPVRRVVSEWARQLGCDGLAQITVPSSEVELSTYQRCRLGTGEALLFTIIGGGHSWPGGVPLPEFIVGKTTQQIDATRVMWDFFAVHPHRR